MSRKRSKRKPIKYNFTLHLHTIISIVLLFITVGTIANTIHSFNANDFQDDYTLIQSGNYKFKMYRYSYPREKFTTLFVDESLKSFDVDLLNIQYDEKLYFHSERELEDFYNFTKTDGTKLYILIDSEHIDLQKEIEGFNYFENICDVKDKTQIFNFGNTKSDKTLVFVDDSLNLYPKNIAYWNLKINPEYICTIKAAEKFYTYFCKNIVSGGNTDSNNYNIYIIVSNSNKELIKICENLK